MAGTARAHTLSLLGKPEMERVGTRWDPWTFPAEEVRKWSAQPEAGVGAGGISRGYVAEPEGPYRS